MAANRLTTRRTVLTATWMIAATSVVTGSTGVPPLDKTGITLDRRRLTTLLRLQQLASRHPGAVGKPSWEPASTPAATATRLLDRYHLLNADERRSVRHGADWWQGNVDLSTPARALSTAETIELDRLVPGTVNDLLAACSVVLSALVPGLTGANNSVAALWVAGLTENGSALWHRRA